MRQLARTLLILGGVTACERAHPVVDDRDRPAVGNIGQTGRPAASSIARRPLVDPSERPAVGNIGQTGAPATTTPPPRRRVQRAQRAARALPRPDPAEVAIHEVRTIDRPLVNELERPMVGNVASKCGPECRRIQERDRLAFQAEQVATPLRDHRARPATANMGRRARMTTPEEQRDEAAAHVAHLERALARARSEDQRRDLEKQLVHARDLHQHLDHQLAQRAERRP